LLEELALDDEIRDPTVVGPRAGADLMQAAAELGLEGVIAKRLDSPYQPGAPSRYWIKAPLNKTGEVVIAGWKSNAALG
jgi:bifunctional non-homologous end joining protein LigD